VSRLHPELLPTTAVLVTVAFATLAFTTPPDPYTQLLYGVPALLVAGGLAALLTHGGGFARLGWSPAGADHAWTFAAFFAVAVLVGAFVPDPTSPVVTAVGPLVGFLLGTWLGWGDGRSRLTGRETTT
jgi:Sec-independent protein secretion pathway component TatC